MIWKTAWELVTATFSEWMEDKAARLGAALAYYSVFSIAPLLMIVIGIAGLVFGEQAARGEIVGEIGNTIGQPAAQAIEDMLKSTHDSGGCLWATVIGLAAMFFGASGVFIQLQDALNTVWKVTPKPGRGVWGIVQERFLSFAVVLGIGFLFLVSLVASAALTALSRFLTPDTVPSGIVVWEVLNFMVSFGLITLFFSAMYKMVPDVRLAWRDVWIGGAVTALLFTVGKSLLGLYLGQSSTTSAFGAAGSLVLLLVWVYYSSQILLLGAEFTRAYANRFGTRAVPADSAMPIAQETRDGQGMPRRETVAAVSNNGSTIYSTVRRWAP